MEQSLFIIGTAFFSFASFRNFFWDTRKERNRSKRIKSAGITRSILGSGALLLAIGGILFISSSYTLFPKIWKFIGILVAIIAVAGLGLSQQAVKNQGEISESLVIENTKIRRYSSPLYIAGLLFWLYSWQAYGSI